WQDGNRNAACDPGQRDRGRQLDRRARQGFAGPRRTESAYPKKQEQHHGYHHRAGPRSTSLLDSTRGHNVKWTGADTGASLVPSSPVGAGNAVGSDVIFRLREGCGETSFVAFNTAQ